MSTDPLGNIGTFGITSVITSFINIGLFIISLFKVAQAKRMANASNMEKKQNVKDHEKDVKTINEKITGIKEYIRDVENRNKDQHDQIRADYVRGIQAIDSKFDSVISLLKTGKHGK